MGERTSSAAGRDVQTLFQVGAVGGLTDGELLERFVSRQEGWSESAFSILVERHGPMVWGVCRRVLNDPHAAADAFQATFLVLVRRAAVIRVDDSLGRWLYGVSRRVALRAKRASTRRSAREVRGVEALTAPATTPALDRTELLVRLDEEIGRLPERYRTAVVLCDLEGLRHEDAARQLGCAVGTVGSRLARGREQLRARLVRRGLAPSAGMVAAALAAEAVAAPLPGQLARSTVQSATQVAMNPARFAEVVSASVATLAEGALKSMVATQWKSITIALFVATLVAGGTAVHALQAPGAASNDAQAERRKSGTHKVPLEDQQTPETTSQPAAELAEQLHDEIALLEAQLAKKRFEIERAEANRQLCLAIVATNFRLNQRKAGMVSNEEVTKAESEVDVALAESQVAQAEVREIELRLSQANRAKGDPRRLIEYLARSRRTDASALERRIERVEQKLDQVLKALAPSGK